jgi:hypothetical protein
MLLLLFGTAVSAGAAMVLLTVYRGRREQALAEAQQMEPPREESSACLHRYLVRPSSWLAIKSRNVLAVQSALGLNNPKPCSWLEGIVGDEKLFIAPPIRGWILVMGSGLPDPADDIDLCFRFLMGLSRKLGHVQFFNANPVLQHQAWVRAEAGRVVRAYAWAGKTLWNQGSQTTAEKELDMISLDYGQSAERASFNQPDILAANVDRVPLLAARWSLDPAGIDERLLEHERGIAGELSRRF